MIKIAQLASNPANGISNIPLNTPEVSDKADVQEVLNRVIGNTENKEKLIKDIETLRENTNDATLQQDLSMLENSLKFTSNPAQASTNPMTQTPETNYIQVAEDLKEKYASKERDSEFLRLIKMCSAVCRKEEEEAIKDVAKLVKYDEKTIKRVLELCKKRIPEYTSYINETEVIPEYVNINDKLAKKSTGELLTRKNWILGALKDVSDKKQKTYLSEQLDAIETTLKNRKIK